MPKTTAAKRSVSAARRRPSQRRPGWVRKNAIDRALDLVIFREELERGFAAVRRSGGVDDVFEPRKAWSTQGITLITNDTDFKRLAPFIKGLRFTAPWP
jgi:hypothetical protein